MAVISKSQYRGQARTESINGKLNFEQDNNRIVGRDANNLIRLLILANGIDFSMKISEDGVDVLEADPDQLIFNSDNNLFKIVYTDSALLTIPARSGSGPYTEGYVELDIDTGVVSAQPLAVIAFWDTSGYLAPSYWQLPFIVNQFNTTTGAYVTQLKVTANTFLSGGTVWVRLIGENAGPAIASDVRYYVLQETAGG